MSGTIQIRQADLTDISTIGYLAYEIWPVAYKGILSFEQLQYMLNLIYHPDALRKQMEKDQHQFLLLYVDQEAVGFASYNCYEFPAVFKLQKLYVHPGQQGKGLGKLLLDEVVTLSVAAGATQLLLNVNRFNKARKFYEKEGFEILLEEKIDIGNGYIMDDYRMVKRLESSKV